MYGSRLYENYVFILCLYNITTNSNEEMPKSVSISRYQKGKAKVKINSNKKYE